MRCVEIAIAAPLKTTLTYSIGTEFNSIQKPIGRRVLVPLGGRLVTGYLLSIIPEIKFDYKIKEISDFLDALPLFQENQIPFFRWVAGYYHYPIGQVIKTALPAGLTTKSVKQIVLSTKGRGESSWPTSNVDVPEWIDLLKNVGFLTPAMSKKILKKPESKKELSLLIRENLVQIDNIVQKDQIKIKKENCLQLATILEENSSLRSHGDFPTFYEQVKFNLDSTLKLSEAKTLFHLSELSKESGTAIVPKKELTGVYSGAGKALKGLTEKKFILNSESRVFRNPFGEQFTFFPRPENLSENQEKVLQSIYESIEAHSFTPFLLHGITGSGKTEVYLRAAEKTLAQGRDVIVLVPEIALATQLESHFVSRFQGQVVLLHSGLSAGEKLDQWSLAASGTAKIVIGARSAIFAPLRNPGLIVVDEEHDHGFKQDDSLHYQGRDLAVLRASQLNAVVILGSATPSITSYYHAVNGKYTLLEMNARVGGRSLPDVKIVDLTKKTNKKAKSKVIRKELREALENNLESKKQSLLLLNRRGFSGTYLCQECGSTAECMHCHVSLTLHKKKQLLVCHYCGYTLTSQTVCSSCHSTQMVPVGFGTERIEEEIQALLPEARLARLDSDTAKDRKKFIAILKAMHRCEIDILIGTQMIAKGHHFPNVTLVGVVWADAGLNMPDFRASERVYQLISQVTGRAGRGESPGKVIIQTMRPDHYSLIHARRHNYRNFYLDEIESRKTPTFPPLVRLVAIRVSGERESDVRNTARCIANACQQCTNKVEGKIEILGPAPSPLDRLCDKFRWQLLLRGERVDALHAVCDWLLREKKHIVTGKAEMTIDVDPENMM